jgi:hypothetical protein
MMKLDENSARHRCDKYKTTYTDLSLDFENLV